MAPTPTIFDENITSVGSIKQSRDSLDSSSTSTSADSISLSSPKYNSKKRTQSKFRFGFLKRRFADGIVKTSNIEVVVSVRPSPEEATKWSTSFHQLVNSKYGQALFKAFLQREFNAEHLEFWLTIEDFRKCKHNKLSKKVQKIFNEFILPDSPKEINLDSATRDNLINVMSQTPSHKIFDQAQLRIQNLLESDAYVRFLKSDLYLELVYPENYQETVLSCSY